VKSQDIKPFAWRPYLDGKIILKRILKKCNIMVWNGLKWLKIELNREHDDTPSGCIIAGTFLTS
jgi:hypothetical protein